MSAADAPASSSQLKWRPARPALATQSAEPGKITPTLPLIVQTAGTSEIAGPSLLPSVPAYNTTAQLGSPFDPTPMPTPMETPGILPPTAPSALQPDANSQPLPPTPSLEIAPPSGIGELPFPANPDNSGQMPLPSEPYGAQRGRNLMQEDCDEGRREIKNTGLTQALGAAIVNLRFTGTGDLPFECTPEVVNFNQRSWGCLTYTWKASALCHKPLYFEDMSLERYGHSWGPICDPVISAAHFFGTLPILPYKMGVDTPCECQYALGYYRPGNCAPYMIEPFPLSPRGAAVQAGIVVGAVSVLP